MRYINFKYYYVLITCVLGVLALNSCSKDEDDEMNEWTTNYVYLQRDNYLAKEPTFIVTHDPMGLAGEVDYKFYIKTKYPATKDINVSFEVSGDIPNDKISLQTRQVTIKSGETSSELITVTVPDWSFLKDDKAAKDYNMIVYITGLQSSDKNIQISNNQKSKSFKISKISYSPVSPNMPTNWQAVNRSGWEATSSRIYASSYTPANAIDDNLNSTWFAYGMNNNGGACWLNIKLDTPINMVGFSITRENAFGGGYSVKRTTIQIKKEGDTEWTTYEDIYIFNSYNGSAPMFVILDSEIQNVKEFKLNILLPTSFVGLADLNIYKNK